MTETFVSRTINDLSQFGAVSAICGADTFESIPEVELLDVGFANPKERLWERLTRKMMKKNLYYRRIDRAFSKRYSEVISAQENVILFVEFGNTAALIAQSLVQLNRKYAITVHGMDVSAMMRIEEYRSRLCLAANHVNCLGVLCASHHTKRLSILAGVHEEKCLVSRYPLESTRLNKDSSISKTDHPSFVHLGRLTEKKHPLATLEAFRIVKEHISLARLSFIGDGELKDQLELRINELRLSDSVEVLGAMNQDEALRKMQEHWVFVQHSVTSTFGDQEGFALSPAEAALMEMPVISTLHNGIPEHVIDGKTGFLVREFDYEAMADRMIQLVRDPVLLNDFGQAGRVNIKNLCDPQKRLRDLEKIFLRA